MCTNLLYKIVKGPLYNRWGTFTDFQNGHAIFIKCGRCYQCLVFRSLRWQNRLLMEAEFTMLNSGFMYFVTLTYSPQNLFKINTPFGYLYECQKMFKRIRKNHPSLKIKYFLVTELGESTGRVHHHLIIFSNLDFLFKKTGGKNINGHYYYQNDNLSWPNGIYLINQIDLKHIYSSEKLSYVIKYVLKYLVKNPFHYSFSRDIGIARINSLFNESTGLYVYRGFLFKHPKYRNLLTNDEKIAANINSFSKFIVAKKFKDDLRFAKKWI